jgi:hypothetical protein
MKGHLEDKLDYYRGDTQTYFLKALIAREGASLDKYNIIKYLFSSSYIKEGSTYVDLRCVSCLLHLLPMRLSIYLSFLLQYEEELLSDRLDESYIKEVWAPIKVLELSSNLCNRSIGNRISSILTSRARLDMHRELALLLDIDYVPNRIGHVNSRLEEAFISLGISEREQVILMELVCFRNKSKALDLLTADWQFSQHSIYELRGMLNDWKP